MGKAKDDHDPWELVDPPTTGKKWAEKSCWEKIVSCVIVLILVAFFLGFLYLFVCSLDFLSSAFRLLGGKAAGEAFRANDILTNPIADLMMGVLATVLLQSSSTTTSIVVAMVGSEIMPLRPAIFIVMGANIGTSVTNTIVSMGQVMDKDEFRRAFAGATVHDMFNWLAVIVLLPIEWLSGSFGSWTDCGLLCQITEQIVKGIDSAEISKQDLLKVITSPFTKKIIQIDKAIVSEIALWNVTADGPIPDKSLMKRCTSTNKVPYLIPANASDPNSTCAIGFQDEKVPAACGYMFEGVVDSWSDAEIGVSVLIFALGVLIICLVCIVKILHYLLKGKIAIIIKKFLNSNIPGGRCGKELTGYLAILIGAGLTMLVQSSSIFTSAMTPLVGVGVLHIKRMYPLTLGANIGTTITAILAALAISGSGFRDSLQIALCHLFFNILGIIVWYPVPFMRSVPIAIAKSLGNTTAKYRWFAFFYLFLMFFILPAAIFGLSLLGWKVMAGVCIPLVVFFGVIITINNMQRKCAGSLPSCMRDWSCCPRPLHSLGFYNYLCTCCGRCQCQPDRGTEDDEELSEVAVTSNGQKSHDQNGDLSTKNNELNGEDNTGYEPY